MDEHDDLISSGRNIELLKITIQPKPFQPHLVRPSVEIQRMANLRQEFLMIENFAAEHEDENLYSRDFTKEEISSSIEGMASVQNQALVNRVMATGMEEKRHLLCQGRSGMAPDLHCLMLHHMDPYLRLGPFKLEIASVEPFIGVLRAVYSSSQTVEVREVKIEFPNLVSIYEKGARGRMKATPLTVKGKEEAYTGTRSSKVGKCETAWTACYA